MPEPRRVAVVGDAGHYVGPELARHLAVRGYARLFIQNTWLHDDTYDYTEGIRWWRSAATDPEQLGGDMPTGDIVAGSPRRPDLDAETIRAAFDAPFPDAASKAGARRFPYCLPFAEPELGDADLQASTRRLLGTWDIPIHIAFGDADGVFTWEWAEQWATELPGATLDRVPEAGHFVQMEPPEDELAVIRIHLPSAAPS